MAFKNASKNHELPTPASDYLSVWEVAAGHRQRSHSWF
jgi:hypothetical protein